MRKLLVMRLLKAKSLVSRFLSLPRDGGVDAAHRTVALFEPLRGRNKARMALETLMRNL